MGNEGLPEAAEGTVGTFGKGFFTAPGDGSGDFGASGRFAGGTSAFLARGTGDVWDFACGDDIFGISEIGLFGTAGIGFRGGTAFSTLPKSKTSVSRIVGGDFAVLPECAGDDAAVASAAGIDGVFFFSEESGFLTIVPSGIFTGTMGSDIGWRF